VARRPSSNLFRRRTVLVLAYSIMALSTGNDGKNERHGHEADQSPGQGRHRGPPPCGRRGLVPHRCSFCRLSPAPPPPQRRCKADMESL